MIKINWKVLYFKEMHALRKSVPAV